VSENIDRKNWVTVYKKCTKNGIKLSFMNNLEYRLAKDKYTATAHDNYLAMSLTVRDRIVERWIDTQQKYHDINAKRVYYLSMEFLIGRLFMSNVHNLGMWNSTKAAVEEMGMDLNEMRDQELDAGLGNGGLGRLAACFLDSMATLKIPAHGYGIRYDYGIFHQKIINGEQVEFPDEWLSKGTPWEIARPEYVVKIKFGGHTEKIFDDKGKMHVVWVETNDILAMPFDVPVVGYKNDIVNTLRLWSAKGTEEFDFSYFNDGDYERAVYNKVFSENISKVLYPNDNLNRGKELRLKQEYFFTAASISDIMRRFKADNADWKKFSDKVAIQLNDTHPALAIPELMRLLIDKENLEWEDAWDVTVKTFAYTNHTVMPEALERWPVSIFEKLLPRHLEIIYEINARFIDKLQEFGKDADIISQLSIISGNDKNKHVRMANLSVIGSHSVNGVSELHSDLIKRFLFKGFYDIWPEKFNNKTNGITQRRWLQKSNLRLSELITGVIGDKWVSDLYVLKRLLPFAGKKSFQDKWNEVKKSNKKHLAEYIRKTTGVIVSIDSMFDVHVKRIHEYKRQMLFALHIASRYIKLKDNPKLQVLPKTYIISGKAAPGYFMAKQIIKFINNMSGVINEDRSIRDMMKVIFLENYRVSLAERIFPASDLSEQISTAGTEASGTGCMKFMLNGALTIGTRDGANIEMGKEVGDENMFFFGLTADEVHDLQTKGYSPHEYVKKSQDLDRVLKLIRDGFFDRGQPGIFNELWDSVYNKDKYLLCADFYDYCRAQGDAEREYQMRDIWLKKSIINVACSGKFSSDRTIREYAGDIWKI